MTKMDDHAECRDEYRIPVVKNCEKLPFIEDDPEFPQKESERKQWNHNHERLFQATTELRDSYVGVEQLQRWTKLPYSHPAIRTFTGFDAPSLQDISVEDEWKSLKTRTLNVKKLEGVVWKLLAILWECATSETPHALPNSPHQSIEEGMWSSPRTLLRFWDKDARAKFYKDLAFVSPNWRNSRPAQGLDELKKFGILTTSTPRGHCENLSKASKWISMSSSPSWISEQIKRKTDARVALISTARMERLNILFRRTDFLVQELGAELFHGRVTPNVIQYASNRHFIAYGMIPAMCVAKIFNGSEFQEICDANSAQIQVEGSDFFLRYAQEDSAVTGLEEGVASLNL